MIPRTLFTEEHDLFRQSAKQFFEKEVAPFHDEWEKQGHVPRELWRKSRGFRFPLRYYARRIWRSRFGF